MRSLTAFVILSSIAIFFLTGLGYEWWMIGDAQNDASLALASAEEKLGIDSWSRNMRSIQIDESEKLRIIDNAVLRRTELINFIELLESTGKKMGLALTISSVRDDPKVKTEVRLTVETLGNWEPSIRFLRMLQSLPYKSNIEESTLSVESGKWRNTSGLRISLTPES